MTSASLEPQVSSVQILQKRDVQVQILQIAFRSVGLRPGLGSAGTVLVYIHAHAIHSASLPRKIRELILRRKGEKERHHYRRIDSVAK